MKIKRRRKSSRAKGTRLNYRGYKNRTKGSGNRGGYGMAGTGKRADQRKTFVINLYGNDYFGKDKRGHHLEKKKMPSISLRTLSETLGTLAKKGIAKESKGMWEIDLKKYKIIGNSFNVRAKITAAAASPGAIEAVKKAGGEIVLSNK